MDDTVAAAADPDKSLLATIQQQAQELQQLRNENAALRQALAVRSADVPAVSTSTPRFSSEPTKLREFLNALTVYFAFRPTQFTHDKTKVGYHLSALSGLALAWATPMLVAETTWVERTLVTLFRRGLKEEIKDELVHSTRVEDLRGLMDQALSIEYRLQERRMEKRKSRGSSQPSTSRVFMHRPTNLVLPPETPKANLCKWIPIEAHFPLASGKTDVGEDYACIVVLLATCSGPAPFILKVIGKRHFPSSVRREGTGSSAIPSISSFKDNATTLFMLPVTLHLPDGRQERTLALLDCGASGIYMDKTWATTQQIPTRPKEIPEQVHTVDGFLISSDPADTTTMTLSLQFGKHHEHISFDLMSSPNHTIILGIPWFIRHNPYVNWETRTISLSSQFCHENCFASDTYWSPKRLMPTESVTGCSINTVQGVPDHYLEFQDVYQKPTRPVLPPHRDYDCAIPLDPGAIVPFGRMYSLIEPEREVLKEYLQENLHSGLIVQSSSPAVTPLFFVPKKTKDFHHCLDFRGLNKRTIKDRYPLPLIKDILEAVRGTQRFTKLDLRGAYHLLRIKEEDKWKTAFRTPFGHYEYRVMPFGLTNAPSIFQRFMDSVFSDLLNHTNKFTPRYYGPFRILQLINPVTVHLHLPRTWRIHPIFHISQLKPYVPDPYSHQFPCPPPVLVDDVPEHEEPIFVEVFSPFRDFFPLALLLRDTACSWRTHCLQHRGYQKELPLLGPRPNIQEQDPRHSLCGLHGKAAHKS
ncbi:hypothetical protein NDU88_008145 [Pleurodeles waltl]|uniref:ribonuclease H n=1 Tax=Pleurodeles waltl TaxID=8319 RepID=A0AAV7QQX0_PLEWA|nr:hypothetical protein NDU88_008145 [Pleurodeles waltl]